jgi:putative salt-induced outer membrane protein YdiY
MSFLRTRQILYAAATLFALCSATRASAAIVDTFGSFDAKRIGWSSALQAGFSAKGGNTELLELSAGARVQWQGDLHRFRAIGGYARQTSSSEEIAEDALLHLRHNRRLTGPFYSLMFVQSQRNPFQRLQSRTLFGLGARVDFMKSDEGEISLGLAHMFEREELEDVSGSKSHQRLSSFLVAAAKLNASTEFRATVYAQPLWEEFADLRAIGSLVMSVALSERLSIEIGGRVQHDSRPPSAVDETDWGTSTAIRFEI